MRKIFIIILLFALCQSSYAQLVWKTKFQIAAERTGVVFKVIEADVCEVQAKLPRNMGRTSFNLSTSTFMESDGSGKVSQMTMTYGKGLLASVANLNISEIDQIIDAIEKIAIDNDLVYIAETANLKLSWEKKTGNIMVSFPDMDSKPGDFIFSEKVAVAHDDFIIGLKKVQASL